MLSEGRVLSIKEMQERGYRPAYKPIQVQTAGEMLEVWQMLPEPEKIPVENQEPQEEDQGIIRFPEQRKQAA